MRRCPQCEAVKMLTLFGKDKQRPDGINFYCRDCHNENRRKKYHATIDKSAHRARLAKWAGLNKDRLRELNRLGHARRREKRNAASRKYRADNLEKVRALCRDWGKKNPERQAEINAARRAAKKRAIPCWADDEFNRLVVRECFDLANSRTRLTGIEWHVDHRVPLRSHLVCGLHWYANLQVIPASINHSKNNLVWQDMP